jgi:putative PIG3 family NAD(P)H quinone oxidoreductase
MRAIVLESYGGPEVLQLKEVPDPVPGPDEVLVGITATALNRADILQRLGGYPAPGPKPAHEIPGLELAGTVLAVGERCSVLREGDAVMGIVSGGAYAERIAVHERQLMRVPTNISLADAAAIPEVFLTAWDALVVQGGMGPGSTVLVHAGASGVGTAAIQLAKAYGARIAVTASAGKLDACRALGADLAVERSPSDWLSEVRAWAPEGVHAVLDVVGGDELERNIDALAVQGRIVQVGVMGSGRATFSLGKLLPKRASLTGTVLRARPIEEKIAVTRRFAKEVLPWFADGTLVPVIDRRFPLAEIAAAQAVIEANANVGKVLIDVS